MSRAIRERRPTLTRERVLDAGIELADRDGIGGLSMRSLGQALGVEAMSLYTHVRAKDDLLEGMVDRVVAGIQAPPAGEDWRTTLRATIIAARAVMLRHPWAARVMESQQAPGPATIDYMDRVATILIESGFTMALAHHGLHALGSRVFGFNQDLFDDTPADDNEAAAAAAAQQLGVAYPNLAAIAATASHEGGLGGCDDDIEFAFGLDLILDGLEARHSAEAAD